LIGLEKYAILLLINVDFRLRTEAERGQPFGKEP
jgi:hypothetical protein